MGTPTQKCFDQTYVKLYYIPPKDAKPAADCKQVKVTKSPELRIFTGQISKLEGSGRGDHIGIDVVCSNVSGHGAGGVVLLLQVSGYIEWEIEFVPAPPPQFTPKPRPIDVFRPPPPPPLNHSPVRPSVPAPLPPIRETHRVFVSLPMMYVIEGPKIALAILGARLGLSPLFVLSNYTAKILLAYKKLREVDLLLHRVRLDLVTAKRGFCPGDVRLLEEGLKTLEKELAGSIRRYWATGGDDKRISAFMRGRGDGAGRFLGDRLA